MHQVNFRLGRKPFTKVAKSSVSALPLEVAPTTSSMYSLYNATPPVCLWNFPLKENVSNVRTSSTKRIRACIGS